MDGLKEFKKFCKNPEAHFRNFRPIFQKSRVSFVGLSEPGNVELVNDAKYFDSEYQALRTSWAI